MTNDDQEEDFPRSSDWLEAEQSLDAMPDLKTRDWIEWARRDGVSLKALYCVIVSQIDDVFHEMAPEVNGPRVLRGMAVNRQVVRGEIKAAHKMQETIERIFNKDLPPA